MKLDQRAWELRLLVFRALKAAGRGHVGSALSLVEIVRVLYDDVLQFKADDPQWINRDRCILSKGHGCLALYAILADKKFFPRGELDSFCQFDSILGGHPEPKVPGVEMSTGSLGHGLAVGVGMAIAAKIQKRKSKVFVIMGDGEINEGSVWESALSAGKHQLSNLTAIIDYNKMQSYGPLNEVLNLEPLSGKWQSFGFNVVEVNGHDVSALKTIFRDISYESGKPNVVICHTVKGKGLKLAEDNAKWHHKSKLDMDEIAGIQDALTMEMNECELLV
ncbi:MAG: transketolase [Gammaproteobacteria bacterium RIFCSPHIGHO2_12_FULL_37_14]|nr:MAG: transketolase [Gammaproteobacteria bacterium RIFCSPHIGHO2_12_FULL_37_14]